MTSGERLAAGAFAAWCGVLLALHFWSPALDLTWSYAHLWRDPRLGLLAIALVVALPPAVAWAWSLPVARAPLRPLSGATLLAAVAAGIVLVPLSLRHPTQAVALDSWWVLECIRDPIANQNTRWHLILWSLRTLAAPWLGLVSLETAVRGLNTFLAWLGLLALAGTARRLAASRGEAVAITALVWSALGVCQLVIAYLDVYPFALLIQSLYLWTGCRALDRSGRVTWPIAIAMVAPFFYMGLVLLAPAAGLLALAALRTPAERRDLAAGIALGVLGAGLATVPGFGHPFAWSAYAAALARVSEVPGGYSGSSSLLPLSFLLGVPHALDLVHLVILIDGVGLALFALYGWRGLFERAQPIPGRLQALFLLALTAPYFAYFATMDQLWGAFADWDLFSFGVTAPALFGAFGFVLWGRRRPRAFAWLLGLALATSGVHLLARLNALQVDLPAHLLESPPRVGPRTHLLQPPTP